VGNSSTANRVTDDYGTVGGGGNNQAGDNAGTTADMVFATVGGGGQNTASGGFSTVGGGFNNMASGGPSGLATVGGGINNVASGGGSTVGGGNGNMAIGPVSTIPGGVLNRAGGANSFAAGRHAKANHDGTFVWGDFTEEDFASTAPNQFLIRATGGVGIGTNNPSGNLHIRSSSGNQIVLQQTTPGFAQVLFARTNGVIDSSVSYDTSNDLLYLANGGVQRLVVDNSGNVGIGTSAPDSNLHVKNFSDTGGAIRVGANSTTLATRIIRFGDGNFCTIAESTVDDDDMVITAENVGIKRNPLVNSLEVDGDASKTTAGFWNGNSDRRIKKNVETIGSALEALDKVRLVSFEYTDEYRTAHPSIEERSYMNVIAQEFAEVFPEYVKSSGEKVPGSDEEILQVDPYPLTIYSAAAIQELHEMLRAKDAQIADQGARLADQATRLAALEAAIGELLLQKNGK